MSTPAIETRDLCKRYGRHIAVENLNLRLEPGTVFGMLGPNGSGKTTTILMLMGLTDVTSGTVRVFGLDPARQPLDVKGTVGYMPDTVGFYDDLTARENLRYTGRLGGMRGSDLDARVETVLSRVKLADKADDRVGTFSRGMQQRLGLADALLKKPRIAILDEPTNGLDPQSTHEFLDLIRDLKQEGLTVLLSSHLLERVEAVCDRVGLFHDGRMVLEGTVDDLARQVLGGDYRVEVEVEGGRNVEHALGEVAGVNRVDRLSANAYQLRASGDVRPDVVRAVEAADATLLGLSIARPSLDDVYTEYFREEQRDAA